MNQKKQVRGPSLRQAEVTGAGDGACSLPDAAPSSCGENTNGGSCVLSAYYLPGIAARLHGEAS